MTTSIADELRRKRAGRPSKQPLTFGRRIATLLRAELTAKAGERIKWPSPKYRDDPVGFAHDILGVELWSRQEETLEAIRDHKRVAEATGQKVGKSLTIGCAGIWWYCSWPDATVIATSTTDRQVNAIIWKEISKLVAGAGRCVPCKKEYEALIKGGMSHLEADELMPRPCPHSALIDGNLGRLARTGLRSTTDFRLIQGFTARESEAMAGISGKNLLFLADEGSGIADHIFDAIEGNRAGGARIAMFSNPTRTTGTFFEAFHRKREFYHCIQFSSEETPNYQERREVIPGLAEFDYIEEKRREHGEDSPWFRVRVRGLFPVGEDGKIFSLHAIVQAQERWDDTEAEGRLFLGFDPAGESGTGDETCFCPRRGRKAIRFDTHRGLTEYGQLLAMLSLLVELRDDNEIPVVVCDVEGNVGAKVHTALREYQEQAPSGSKLREYLDKHPEDPLHKFLGNNYVAFDLVTVRASEKALARSKEFRLLRDRLCGNLEEWLREQDGAIPADDKLAVEMHVLVWEKVDDGPLSLIPKREIRKILGRSPDRYDALALAVWEPLWVREGDDLPTTTHPPQQRPQVSHDEPENRPMDPYAGVTVWRK